jgi:hypothetical protein
MHVHATSFDFEFFGPDADILNPVLSQHLVAGGLGDGAILQLVNGDYYEPEFWWDSGPYATWYLGLLPNDYFAGVSFSANNWWSYSLFSTDELGYPVVEPKRTARGARSARPPAMFTTCADQPEGRTSCHSAVGCMVIARNVGRLTLQLVGS